MYSCYEIYEEYLNQYGSNMSKDLTHLTSSIDELPPAITNSEPVLDFPNHPELEISPPTKQLSLS